MSTKPKNNKHPAKKINLKQQAFIDNYLNQGNNTFGNGTQSYKQAYNNDNGNVAAVEANRLLNNPNIKSEMDRLILEMNLGAKVRLNTIQEVMTGKALQETITTSTDSEGKEYTSTTTKAPTASDRLKAVDLLAKIDGTYDKNKVKAELVSTELKGLIRQQRKALQGEQGQGTGGGGK